MGDTKNTPHNINDAIRRLESATNNGGHKLSEDLDMLKQHLKTIKDELKEAAQSAMEEPLAKAREGLKKGQEAAQEFGKDVDRRVHDNPWYAIGIVAFVMFLVGFLVGRKD